MQVKFRIYQVFSGVHVKFKFYQVFSGVHVKFRFCQVFSGVNVKLRVDKSNYRPVTILPVFSKFFERAIYEQLTEYINNHFHPFLSAFRSGYGCNTTILKIIEVWK